MTKKNHYKQRISEMVVKESIWELQDTVKKLKDVFDETFQEWRKLINKFSLRLIKLEKKQYGK